MGRTGTTDRTRTTETTRAANALRGVIGQFALGKFELLKLIGQGSNGEVYLARPRNQPKSLVVVKRVKPHVMDNPRFRQFFQSEVQSMSRFRHPYVVQLFDASLDDPIGPCMVMEYINGVTLEALLEKYPRWYPERMGRLIGMLCHALQAAHDAGIMHRDLKPANLMVTDFNTPKESLKVMDFGFAGFTEKPFIQLAEITGQGPVFACGTPAYVSPEMVKGDTVDHRADLYSVGVMMYEMLAGRLPFDFPTVAEILEGHQQMSPPRFHKLGVTGISTNVEHVVQIALCKYPSERQPTAKELARHFGSAVSCDIWDESAPPNYSPTATSKTIQISVDRTVVNAPAPGSREDQFTLFDRFEAMLPPKLAAMKLKAFVEEVGGDVIESEPGLIRMRVGLPAGWKPQPTRSAVMNWISAIRGSPIRKGEEPIEFKLKMQNVDANRVAVCVSFHPLPEFMPDDLPTWQERCEELYNTLRMFLMAQ